MERRAAVKGLILGSGALLLGPQGCSVSAPATNTDPNKHPQDTKQLFLELGTCSRTLFYVLNREFGYPKETEEQAADPLMGGILQKGHQCGMLWGASLAVGAESCRRCETRSQAIGQTLTATQHLIKSFSNRAKSVNCRDITDCDLTTTFGLVKLILFKRQTCLGLAEQWAPEAIQSATEGLSHDQTGLPQHPLSCASEVARKMGASDEEMVMVSGFAGGLGLSGNGCGALSAAIWMKNLAWLRNQTDSKPDTEMISKVFNGMTDSKMLCRKISGRGFQTIGDHTEYVKNGGCAKLIDVLAQV